MSLVGDGILVGINYITTRRIITAWRTQLFLNQMRRSLFLINFSVSQFPHNYHFNGKLEEKNNHRRTNNIILNDRKKTKVSLRKTSCLINLNFFPPSGARYGRRYVSLCRGRSVSWSSVQGAERQKTTSYCVCCLGTLWNHDEIHWWTRS